MSVRSDSSLPRPTFSTQPAVPLSKSHDVESRARSVPILIRLDLDSHPGRFGLCPEILFMVLVLLLLHFCLRALHMFYQVTKKFDPSISPHKNKEESKKYFFHAIVKATNAV